MSTRWPGATEMASARSAAAGTFSTSAAVLATTTCPGDPSTPSARARWPMRCGAMPTAPPAMAPRDGHSATASCPSSAVRSIARSRASSSRAGTTSSGRPLRCAIAASTTAHAGRPSTRLPAACPASRRSAASETGPEASTSLSSAVVITRWARRVPRPPRRHLPLPAGVRPGRGRARLPGGHGSGRWPPPSRRPARPPSWRDRR